MSAASDSACSELMERWTFHLASARRNLGDASLDLWPMRVGYFGGARVMAAHLRMFPDDADLAGVISDLRAGAIKMVHAFNRQVAPADVDGEPCVFDDLWPLMGGEYGDEPLIHSQIRVWAYTGAHDATVLVAGTAASRIAVSDGLVDACGVWASEQALSAQLPDREG